MSYIDFFKPISNISPCKLCGRMPIFKKTQVTYGHGEYPIVGWVECTCGVRTKEFIIDGFYGCTDTPDSPVSVWNQLMTRIR